jgi:hypothetical protein
MLPYTVTGAEGTTRARHRSDGKAFLDSAAKSTRPCYNLGVVSGQESPMKFRSRLSRRKSRHSSFAALFLYWSNTSHIDRPLEDFVLDAVNRGQATPIQSFASWFSSSAHR